MAGIWIAAGKDRVHVLEHEGDYEDTDVLINVTVNDSGRPSIEIVKPDIEIPKLEINPLGEGQ